MAPGHADRRPVREAFADEAPRLLRLPQHPFETDLVRPIASGKTPYVRFDGNDSSIPHDLVRKPLTLAAGETTVRILDGALEIARHVRSYDRARRVESPLHLAALAEEKRRARELRGRDRLRAACPHAHDFLLAVAHRGDRVAVHTIRLLALLDRFGERELDAAIADALERGALSAQSVAHILDQTAREKRLKPPLPPVVSLHPRANDVVVTPHALAPYDALAHKREDADRE